MIASRLDCTGETVLAGPASRHSPESVLQDLAHNRHPNVLTAAARQ